MMRDSRGLALSTASDSAADSLESALSAYLHFQADTAARAARTVELDPDFALAHCFKGYLALLPFDARLLPAVRAVAAEATAKSASATSREKMHVAALAAWSRGEIEAALRLWNDIAAEHPRDLLALRLSHFHLFWLGRAARMWDQASAVHHRWSSSDPGYSTLLAMLAFAVEECGEYEQAEEWGRRAIDLDPAEAWATHAVAHVMEMQGRHEDGVGWMAERMPKLSGLNNFQFHLGWHRALFHLESEGPEGALARYDAWVRDLASPLVAAAPDLYIDVQNAASLLWRLERLGIEVGGRWRELADRAEARIGDIGQPFTLPHFAMALAADGRDAAAGRMLETLEAIGRSRIDPAAETVRHVALPACRGVVAHRQGRHAEACRLLAPIRQEFWRLGASHAQRDVLWQVLFEAAVKAADGDLVAELKIDLAGMRPVAAESRRVYAAILARA
jgi:tetratricopeptide (TPR) repeat protein